LSRIYKILDRPAWDEALASGLFTGSAVDAADGYIHFSTAEQAAETGRRYFSGRADLVLLTVESDTLGDALKWEPSRGGALFPHLYGPLPTERVIAVRAIAMDNDGAPRLDGLEP
jgi:uncharacterized protein (DUF952 family)